MPSSLKKKTHRAKSSKKPTSKNSARKKTSSKKSPANKKGKKGEQSGTDWVEIRETEVGQGVFATRRILEGTTIAKIEGEVIDDPDHSSNYCMDLGGDFSLEPYAPFRFLNHSCTPNCCLAMDDFIGKSIDNVPGVWLEAITKIMPGEELTIDYAWPAYHAIECLCGSDDCRGWIVDKSELSQVKKKSGKGSRRT